jgi:hypothetical protein
VTASPVNLCSRVRDPIRFAVYSSAVSVVYTSVYSVVNWDANDSVDWPVRSVMREELA